MKLIRCLLILLFCFMQSTLALGEETLVIHIQCASKPAQKNIEARLAVLQQSYGKELTAANIQHFFKNAPTHIYQALEPFGYFKAKIISQHLTRHLQQSTASYVIAVGPALPLQKVDVTLMGPGKNNAELMKLVKNFPLKADQPFQTESYLAAQDLLFKTANNQGYLHAFLQKKEIRINLKAYTAVIILHLMTGPRFYFGTTQFSDSPFATDFLQRFSSFQVGEPFSSKKLLTLQENLSKSRYFQQVVVTPDLQHIQPNKQVPINVVLTVPKTKQYSMGIGYGTFTGPRLTLGTDYRRIGQYGQHFTTQLKLSSVLKGLAAKYFIPGKHPLTEQYTLGADAEKFLPKNGQSFSENFSGGYIKTINNWEHSISANYLVERFQIETRPSEVSRLLYPSYALARIKMDDAVYPRLGHSIQLTLRGANKHVLASSSFVQSEIKGKYIFSPTSASRVLLRGNLGYTTVHDLSRLPLTLRYFAGGLGSIRGYNFSSIGPGRYLKTASIEFQHKIYGDMSAAVFYDAGNASNQFNSRWLRGEGVGVIYHSMIGPATVYLGRAISYSRKPFSIEFSIGPDF